MNPAELRQTLDTIVVVMMENRSFDHALGHLSLPQFENWGEVRGLGDLNTPDYGNSAPDGTLVFPYLMDDGPLPNDVPHERNFVKTQLGDTYTMTGFVQAYNDFLGTGVDLRPPSMGMMAPKDVPVTTFLATTFQVCDAWFAPLPTSTQPNRLMAMGGDTFRDVTVNGLMLNQPLVFDWLEKRGIRWRVYSAGLPFFTLMDKVWPYMVTDHFRPFDHLMHDLQNEDAATWPQVIFIEPDFTDAPVHPSGHAEDNHPPTPMAFGEAFLRKVYASVTADAGRWSRLAMFVTYDEHGGFFDHVRPLNVPYAPPAGITFTPFTTTGVRVPALVVSPFVNPRSVCHESLDHTSILQLLAERFGNNGEGYSPSVDARKAAGIRSAAVTLVNPAPQAAAPSLPDTPLQATASLMSPLNPTSDQQMAFHAGASGFLQKYGSQATSKFPVLVNLPKP